MLQTLKNRTAMITILSLNLRLCDNFTQEKLRPYANSRFDILTGVRARTVMVIYKGHLMISYHWQSHPLKV